MVNAHVGDLGVAKVRMVDGSGSPTETYDVLGGINYVSSDPASVDVIDDDADPKDATLEFRHITTAPVTITVTFDGAVGEEVERLITLVSEEINVVAGEAVGGSIEIEFFPV